MCAKPIFNQGKERMQHTCSLLPGKRRMAPLAQYPEPGGGGASHGSAAGNPFHLTPFMIAWRRRPPGGGPSRGEGSATNPS